jgi:hypothetical protein
MKSTLRQTANDEGVLRATLVPAGQVDAVRGQIHKYFDLAKEPSYKDYRRWQATLQDRVVRIIRPAHVLLSSCQHSPCFVAC